MWAGSPDAPGFSGAVAQQLWHHGPCLYCSPSSGSSTGSSPPTFTPTDACSSLVSRCIAQRHLCQAVAVSLERLLPPRCSHWGLPTWLSGKESTCSARDLGLILDLGRSPGKGNGNPLQCACLENSMDSGA